MDINKLENETKEVSFGDDKETFPIKKTNEIDLLKEESEMPIEELMKIYGKKNTEENENKVKIEIEDEEEDDDEDEEEEEEEDYSDDDEDITESEQEENEEVIENENGKNSLGDENKNESKTKKRKRPASNLIKLMNENDVLSDCEDSDEDFDPDNYSKKRIKIGDEFQAEIKSNNDTNDTSILCWSPSRLEEDKVAEFLRRIHQDSIKIIEDELALEILNLCDYQIDVALEKYTNETSNNLKQKKWSEEQSIAFEEGFKLHGKNFYKIKNECISERSVRELVEYYYLWKKSERYDVFVNKYNIKKRNGLLNPYVTDLMQQIIKEHEEALKQSENSKDTTQIDIDLKKQN